MPFASEKQRRFLWSQHPDIAQRWADEEKAARKKSKKGKRKLPMYVADVGKWNVGVQKPKRTKPAKPARPAKPAAPVVAFATHAAFEREIEEMYAPIVGKAGASVYGGLGASPAPRDPIPDYADIYYQPDDSPNRERERAANESRRASVSARNRGKFGFHGEAQVEPELRYERDDYPMTARRGHAQSPSKRKPKNMDLNVYDQPVDHPEPRLVVKRNVAPVQRREASGPQREPQRLVGRMGRNPKPARSGGEGVRFSGTTNEAMHSHRPKKPKVASAPATVHGKPKGSHPHAHRQPLATAPLASQRSPAYTRMGS